jgi:hypothetical protein
MESIASAARELVKKRDIWLNPPGASDQELKRRTLTKLYNQNPTWLKDVHRELDEAVLGAYGWPESSSDQEILTRLLKLNAERFAAEQAQKSLKFETEQAPKKVAASVTIAQKQKQKQKLKSWFPNHVLTEQVVKFPELLLQRLLVVARNTAMRLGEFHERSVAEFWPAARVNQFSALAASCPSANGLVLKDPSLSPRHDKILARKDFEHGTGRAEVALVSALRY